MAKKKHNYDQIFETPPVNKVFHMFLTVALIFLFVFTTMAIVHFATYGKIELFVLSSPFIGAFVFVLWFWVRDVRRMWKHEAKQSGE